MGFCPRAFVEQRALNLALCFYQGTDVGISPLLTSFFLHHRKKIALEGGVYYDLPPMSDL